MCSSTQGAGAVCRPSRFVIVIYFVNVRSEHRSAADRDPALMSRLARRERVTCRLSASLRVQYCESSCERTADGQRSAGGEDRIDRIDQTRSANMTGSPLRAAPVGSWAIAVCVRLR